MTSIQACVLASGGLDSTTLVYDLLAKGMKIRVIFINYGQHFYDTELSALKKVLPVEIFEDIKIIDISSAYTESRSPLIKRYDLWQTNVVDEMLYVPFRSLTMISAAMAYSQSIGVSQLYAAFIDSNHVKDIDATSFFLDSLIKTTDVYESVKLNLPLRNMTKLDVVKLGISVNAPIEKTYSCQINLEIPCGACPNCVDRATAISSWQAENV